MSELSYLGAIEPPRQTVKFFEMLLQASADGIVITDATQSVVLVNKEFCGFFGRRPPDVIETSLFVWLEQLQPDAPRRWAELERRVHQEGTCRDVEFQMTTQDGRRHLSVNASLLQRVADEERGVIISIWRDVTEYKRSAEGLRESEEKFRLIADNVTDMVWAGEIEGLTKLVDADARAVVETSAGELLDRWRFTFISPSIKRVLGYEVHEGMRLTPKELLTAASHSTLQQTLSEELALERSGEADPSRQRTLELEHVTNDGRHRWCEVGMRFLRDQKDQVTGVVGSTRDISLRKDLEREISAAAVHEQQRIGQELHDGLGQQLLGLGLMAKSLQKTLEGRGAAETESAGELVQVAKDAYNHVRAMIKGVQPVGVAAGGLMAALGNLADSAQQLTGVCCNFECREPVAVENDLAATQLFHVAQEAVRNAVKHACAKHITVGLGRCGQRLRLWICDDGRGLPAELGRTDGMGLRIMCYRAALIGGTLAVEPDQGDGTLVTCTVPLEQLR